MQQSDDAVAVFGGGALLVFAVALGITLYGVFA
jgi:hypothetical protein